MWITYMLALLISATVSQPITIKCGKCQGLPQCKSGICKQYNGSGFVNLEQCIQDANNCPSGQQNSYYPAFCTRDTNYTQCVSGCCLKYLPISTAKTFCTDKLFRPELYCEKVFKNEVIALIIVIGLTSLCLGSIVLGFFISKCCKNAQDLEREAELQQVKKIDEVNKQRRGQRNKIVAIPNESTLKSGNVSNNNSIGIISKNSISIADQLGRQIALESNQALSRADI